MKKSKETTWRIITIVCCIIWPIAIVQLIYHIATKGFSWHSDIRIIIHCLIFGVIACGSYVSYIKRKRGWFESTSFSFYITNVWTTSNNAKDQTMNNDSNIAMPTKSFCGDMIDQLDDCNRPYNTTYNSYYPPSSFLTLFHKRIVEGLFSFRNFSLTNLPPPPSISQIFRNLFAMATKLYFAQHV